MLTYFENFENNLDPYIKNTDDQNNNDNHIIGN